MDAERFRAGFGNLFGAVGGQRLAQNSLKHLNLEEESLDLYALAASKAERMSWGELSNHTCLLDNKEVVQWIVQLRDLSNETAEKIVFEGLLDSQFHNITFVLGVVNGGDFEDITSQAGYCFLHDFVLSTPLFFQEWIEEPDFNMSRDVLALLAKRS